MFKKISDRIDEKAVAIIEWIQKKVNSDYDKLQAYPGLCTTDLHLTPSPQETDLTS